MSVTVKVILIIIIAGLLATITFVFVIPYVKRKKLSEAWAQILQKSGSKMTAKDLQNSFKALSNKEINTMILFSQKLQQKDYMAAAAMIKDVSPLLVKTGLSGFDFGKAISP